MSETSVVNSSAIAKQPQRFGSQSQDESKAKNGRECELPDKERSYQ